MIDIVYILNQIDNVMYFPILIIVMAVAGLYFTIRTQGVQVRLFFESIRLILEPSGDENSVSSLQAMLVSTASRVGTGNIIGVSTAICLGGPGACFWMWVMCIIGASSAFIESTLAQIFKRKDENGNFYGGPAYYIEEGLKLDTDESKQNLRFDEIVCYEKKLDFETAAIKARAYVELYPTDEAGQREYRFLKTRVSSSGGSETSAEQTAGEPASAETSADTASETGMTSGDTASAAQQ